MSERLSVEEVLRRHDEEGGEKGTSQVKSLEAESKRNGLPVSEGYEDPDSWRFVVAIGDGSVTVNNCKRSSGLSFATREDVARYKEFLRREGFSERVVVFDFAFEKGPLPVAVESFDPSVGPLREDA